MLVSDALSGFERNILFRRLTDGIGPEQSLVRWFLQKSHQLRNVERRAWEPPAIVSFSGD